MEPRIEDYQSFSTEFLQEYLSNGFGVMSKHEIDILVMNLLMKYGNLGENSNHDLSLLFRIPESTIKRLRYEARLRYQPDANYLRNAFIRVLDKAEFELDRINTGNVENAKLVFAMEDNYLRYEIQGRLKAKGMYADSSFNSEIVKIGFKPMILVISELCGEEAAQDFEVRFKSLKQDAKQEDLRKTLLSFIQDLTKSVITATITGAMRPGSI